jgi:hypothetical protein
MSSNANTSSSVSLTTTPVVSVLFSAYQTLVNLALADGYLVEVITIPKSWSGSQFTGDSYRIALNNLILATYQTATVSGVKVCDGASLPIFSTNDPTVYRDGINFTDQAQAYFANFVNSTITSQYPSLISGGSQTIGGNQTLSIDALKPIPQLILGTGGSAPPLIVTAAPGTYTATTIQMGATNNYIQFASWESYVLFAQGGKTISLSTAVSGYIPVIPGSGTLPSILATVTAVNTKTVANTLLYTVPTGKTATITDVVARVTAASAITTGPTIDISSSSGGSGDIFTSVSTGTGFSTVLKVFKFSTGGNSTAVAAAGTVYADLTVAATGTSQTIQYDVIGYLE